MKGTVLTLLLLCGGFELSAQTIVQQFAAVSAGAGQVSDMDLNQATGQGSVLIAMPELLSPGVKVLSVTDNAAEGGNNYKQVKAARSSCANRPVEIWYCENCKAGVTELKFHLSGHVRGSINAFLEVSDVASSSVLDGEGSHVSGGIATSEGEEVGPRIVTSSTDLIIARHSSSTHPTGVKPADWTYKPTYVYALNLPPGSYQPTLTGGSGGGGFCVSMAAFKTAAPLPAAEQPR
jgi:hypothetical protein